MCSQEPIFWCAGNMDGDFPGFPGCAQGLGLRTRARAASWYPWSAVGGYIHIHINMGSYGELYLYFRKEHALNVSPHLYLQTGCRVDSHSAKVKWIGKACWILLSTIHMLE